MFKSMRRLPPRLASLAGELTYFIRPVGNIKIRFLDVYR